jgi:4-hydroxy-3-polyprenylbenzoate decarboxylase
MPILSEISSTAGELKRIAQPVATELEITEIADREMKQPGGGKALLFEKPTVNGVVSPFPVAINTLGSHKRMAMSMGANSVDEVANELGALMKAKPPTSMKEAIKLLSLALDLRHAKPKVVKSGSCKDVIHKFDARMRIRKKMAKAPRQSSVAESILTADLRMTAGTAPRARYQPQRLLEPPILKCWPLDGGRFITLPCVVTRDPDTGERNLGMYRIQIYDDKTTGMHWQLQKVAARHGRRYYEKGERMPVSIFIGGDPMFPFAATAPMPDGWMNFSSPVICARNPSNS